MKNAGVNTRELALDMLLEMEKNGEYGNLLIKNVLDKYDYLDSREKSFLKRLTEGTTERRIQLDYVLEQFSRMPVKKMKPLIRSLLRMSAYQILFMDSVPDSAACNEAVKLAVKRHFQSLRGYVNGVLRSLSRNRESLAWPDREKEPVTYLSVRYSMPEWIVNMWISDYGEEKTEEILAGLLEERPVTIRLAERLGKEEREKLLTDLKACGAGPAAHPLYEGAYTLEKSEGVASLPGFADGMFAVQDVSSMLVAAAAGLRTPVKTEQLFILDVCAAPGGKAVHAAECVAGRGRVEARDLSEKKICYIEENASRMKISNLSVRMWDATVPDESMREKADVLLADLPCSGLGVAGRKADIKYRVSPESLEEVERLQRRILEVVWQYVKPGGLLVYSTCTINRGENEKMAEWLAEQFPLIPVSLSKRLPEECLKERESGPEGEKSNCCQLLPGVHGTDGFFISCFRRAEDVTAPDEKAGNEMAGNEMAADGEDAG